MKNETSNRIGTIIQWVICISLAAVFTIGPIWDHVHREPPVPLEQWLAECDAWEAELRAYQAEHPDCNSIMQAMYEMAVAAEEAPAANRPGQ